MPLSSARWAPSAFNEQPWRYLVARREDEAAFADLLSCLVEANQEWAMHAPVLAIAVVKRTFTRGDRPNPTAFHDLGLAAGRRHLLGDALAEDRGKMLALLPRQLLFQVPSPVGKVQPPDPAVIRVRLLLDITLFEQKA